MSCLKRPPLLLLLLPLVGLACVHLGARKARDPAAIRIARADAAFSRRADPQAMSRSIKNYLDIRAAFPEDPRALAALSRAYYAWAYGHEPVEPPALLLYEDGRESAWACLETVPSFKASLNRLDGRMIASVVRQIPESHASCLLYLLANWTRWVELRGPAAAALDGEALWFLAERSRELTQGREHALALYYSGLSLSLRPPSHEPDLEIAARWFQEAIREDPGNRSIAVDYARGVLIQEGKIQEARDMLTDIRGETSGMSGEYALENERARLRTEKILLEIGD